MCCPNSRNDQIARQELDAKASKSAGENAEEAKAAADAAAAAAVATEGALKSDHVQIDESSFLINLIDSPGHVDFSSEVGGNEPKSFCGYCVYVFVNICNRLGAQLLPDDNKTRSRPAQHLRMRSFFAEFASNGLYGCK